MKQFNAYTTCIASLPSPKSKEAARQKLKKIAGIVSDGSISAEAFPWQSLRREHVEVIRSQLIDSGLKPASINSCLSHMRGVLRASMKLGLMSEIDCTRACDVDGVENKSSTVRGRILTMAELGAIADVCKKPDGGPSNPRDSALLSTMVGAGLQREEITRLELADYDRKNAVLTVREGKQREIPLPAFVVRELNAWIDVRGLDPGPLFLRTKKGRHGKVLKKGIGVNSIYNICRRRARQANVAKFNPNDLRTTFCSSLLAYGGNLLHVQRLMGHASPVTTVKYDKHPTTPKRQTVGLLDGFWE